MTDTMLHKWDGWYEGLTQEDMGAFRYADTVTYQMAAAFLMDMDEVEDWGCGAAGFKRFFEGRYTGVDGSHTPFADKIVDLREYTSDTQSIMMRHVLEHNYDWALVFNNALSSFREKMCLVLFTPFVDETQQIAHNAPHGVDVPDMAFARKDIEGQINAHGCRWMLASEISTPSGYGVEHVYCIIKEKNNG
jgi:hypothetical protein